MLCKLVKKLPTLLISTLCAIVALIAARYAQVLLCDVWRLQCWICR